MSKRRSKNPATARNGGDAPRPQGFAPKSKAESDALVPAACATSQDGQSLRRTLLEFACIALVAICMRGLYFYQLHGTLPFSTLIIDGRAYDAWGQRIASGDWLGSEVFYQAPLYPYLLGVLYAAFGHGPMVVRFAQAALSVTSCLLLAWAGRRYFGPRVGLIAGLLLAVYPPAIFFDGLIQKASLDLWLMTLLLALLAEASQRRSWRWLLAVGVVLGALALNRENARVLYPVIAGWVFLCFREIAPLRRAVWIAAMTAGVALVLLPIGFRNYYVGGEFVMTTSQFGPNFYIGNHAGASGRYEPLAPHRGDPRFERADATRLAEEATGRKLSAGEVSGYWLDRSLDYIRQQPGAWLRLMGWKSFLVLNSQELVDSESIEVYCDSSWLLRFLMRVWHFGVLLPLAVFGVWVSRRRWRELSVLYAIFLALAASTALFYVFARYRFTLAPIAMLFAAEGLTALPHLVMAMRRRDSYRDFAIGGALALVTAIVSNYPLPDDGEKALMYMNLGSGLLYDGQPVLAMEPLNKAIELQADLASAHHNLGLALAAQKLNDAAAKEFASAIQYEPDYGDAQASLGQYYADKGEPAKAIPHLRRAIPLVADPTLLHVELGHLLESQGDAIAAIAEYRAALQANPELPVAINNLAWVLATDPDPKIRSGEEAVRLAERLIDASPAAPKRSPAEEAALVDTVAAAYAEVGRFDDALATVRRGIALAHADGAAQLVEILESRVKLYEARQPYHSKPSPTKTKGSAE